MLELQASTIEEIFRCVQEVSRQWAPSPEDPEELWFRGQGKAYPLLPGLYRADSIRLGYDEENLTERFQQRATPFTDERISTEWDWYFLAQHHGIPTRLLDWTESFLAATYFAIEGHIDFRDRSSYDRARSLSRCPRKYDHDSPEIWVLEAGSLNLESAGSDSVFTIGGPFTAGYLREAVSTKRNHDNEHPLAILPKHSNSRLAAQQGTFTIHGHDRRSIDDYARASDSRIKLARIQLDRANISFLWRDLEMCGVSVLSYFPGLDSVAAHTRWFSQISPAEKED